MKLALLFLPFALFAQEAYVPEFTDCTKITACNQGDCAASCSRPQITFNFGNSQTVVKGDSSVLLIGVGVLDIASKVTISLTGTLPVGVSSATLSKLDSTGVPLQHWGTTTDGSFSTYLTVTTTSAAVPGLYSIGPFTGISDNATTTRRTFNQPLNIVSATTGISPAANSVNAGSSLSYTVTYAGHGYDGPIAPSCQIQNSPSGLSVAVSPSSLPPSGGTATATVSVSAGARTNTDYMLICNGSGTGVYLLNAVANVHVN